MPPAEESREGFWGKLWILGMALRYHGGLWLFRAASSENETCTQKLTGNDCFEDWGRERLNFGEADAEVSGYPGKS